MSRLHRKATVVVLSVLAVGLLAAASAATVAIRNERAGQVAQQQQDAESEGVHGGTVERYHGSDCDLTDTSSLEGNWTHGDYVSAVAADDPSKVTEAAHSRCGKPAHAGQGGQALGKSKAAKAKARAEKAQQKAERGGGETEGS